MLQSPWPVRIAAMRHWLFKSEPSTFSIDDLAAEPEKTACWDGVRNYQARNLLRDEVAKGDRVLFHHSNAKPPGVAGIAEVVREGYGDHTAWDPESKYFDPKSTPEEPRWYMVDVRFVEKLPRFVPLPELREVAALADMPLLNRSRLSIQPVTKRQFERIVAMGRNG